MLQLNNVEDPFYYTCSYTPLHQVDSLIRKCMFYSGERDQEVVYILSEHKKKLRKGNFVLSLNLSPSRAHGHYAKAYG